MVSNVFKISLKHKPIMGWKDFFEKLKLLFVNTKEAYKKINKEKGITTAFLLLVVILILTKLISFIAINILSVIMKLKSFQIPSYNLTEHFISFIYMIVGSFLVVLLLHLIIKIFKGKANLAITYRIFIYSILPYLLLKSIPIIGRLSEALSLYLYISGIYYLHKIKPIPAVITFLIPLIIIAGIVFYFSLTSIHLFGGI